MDRQVVSLVLGRLGLALVTILIVSFVVFAATAMLPGDVAQILLGQAATEEAVAGLRAAMHLDDPAILRFLRWLAGLAPGRPRHLLRQQHARRRADRRPARQHAQARGGHHHGGGARGALPRHHHRHVPRPALRPGR